MNDVYYEKSSKILDEMGEEGEQYVKPILPIMYKGQTFIKTPPFHWADFESEDYFIEVKHRGISVRKYSTTIVKTHKIKTYLGLINSKATTKNFVIFFKFYDGLYYWNFNKNQYSLKVVNQISHYEIPIRYLIEFNIDQKEED